MDLLWSSEYDEEICESFYECQECDEDYACCTGGIYPNDRAYDLLNDIIKENFNQKFGKNEYRYFVIGQDYTNYYGFKQNFVGNYSYLYDSIDELMNKFIIGEGQESHRIWRDKYNRMVIERSHHDGKEYYLVCRLNSVGQECYDKGYNIDFRKYKVVGVLKDFDYFNYVKV